MTVVKSIEQLSLGSSARGQCGEKGGIVAFDVLSEQRRFLEDDLTLREVSLGDNAFPFAGNIVNDKVGRCLG